MATVVGRSHAPAIAVGRYAYDFVTRGRVHPVYIWGGSALVLSVPLRLALGSTAAWQSFAAAIVGLV